MSQHVVGGLLRSGDERVEIGSQFLQPIEIDGHPHLFHICQRALQRQFDVIEQSGDASPSQFRAQRLREIVDRARGAQRRIRIVIRLVAEVQGELSLIAGGSGS